jgi:hypothetical protein
METELLVAGGFGAFVALGVLIGVVSYRRVKKRQQDLAAAAARWQLGFEIEPTARARRPFEGLPLFAQGRQKTASNRLFGDMEGLGIEVFDYSYVTGGGKNRRTREQSVVGVAIPGARLPAFVLSPEGVFDKLAAVFGAKDFDFSTHPEFSKRYLLRGDDEHAVRRLFGPTVLAWFERNLGLCVEGAGGVLIVYRTGKLRPVDDVRTALHEGLEIARLLVPGAARKGEAAEG